ncbi:MAG TPA: serine/threonine-protein kinase, partial [Planctomycetota bacterium]|nr:serine/threonine-protein kinase [Planctomycetota bacterium]
MSPAPRSAARPSPFTGKTLGRCVIRKPVGRGGTATVFHATYEPLKKDVAVKILRTGADAAPEAKARFVEEGRALAKLHHPNVVRVFDVVEDQGYLLIIMDFVEGRNLLEVLEDDGPMDAEDAAQVARQVALALDHAHSQKILHRDVKPANVIVNDAGEAVLVDFGNAEVVGEAADRKGTAHYVAPEVFQGKRQDEKCDTYSLGATLFHMLTGRPPFEGQSVKDILKAHEAGKLRAPSQVNPDGDIPKEIDALVRRAMAPARGYR